MVNKLKLKKFIAKEILVLFCSLILLIVLWGLLLLRNATAQSQAADLRQCSAVCSFGYLYAL